VIRRRAWVVLLCPVLAAANAAVFSPKAGAPSYRATAVVVVNSCVVPANGIGPSNCPGSANEANTLATTYAGLIPADAQVLQFVGTQTGLPAATARMRVSVLKETDTALLDLQYTDTDPSRARLGASALAAAITGVRSVTQAVPTGSVTLVRPPDRAMAKGQPPRHLVPIAAVLGLVLGLGLALVLERADARIDGVDDLSREISAPATELDGTHPPVAPLRRWATMTASHPAIVAIVPIGGAREDAGLACRLLANAGGEAGFSTRAFDGPIDARVAEDPRLQEARLHDALLLYPTPPPVAQNFDASSVPRAVVLVSAGAPARLVKAHLGVLADYGIVPMWGLMVSRRLPRGVGRPVGRRSDASPHPALQASGRPRSRVS